MALRFEDIENNVFDGVALKDPGKIERAACGELKYLLGEMQKGHITREQATQAKLKLRDKYEQCQKHIELMEIIQEYILKAQWNFKDNASYIGELLMGANSIAESPDAKKLWLYKDFVFDTVNYFDKNLSRSLTKLDGIKTRGQMMEYVFKQIGCEGYEYENIRRVLLDMKTLWNRLFDLMETQNSNDEIDRIINSMRIMCRALKNIDISINEEN